MSARPSRLGALVVAGVTLVGLAGCGASGSSSPTTSRPGGAESRSVRTIHLGVFAPATETPGTFATDAGQGAKLALSQYASGNPKVRVVVDTVHGGGASQAAAAAQALVADKVVAVLGPNSSTDAEAADPILDRAGIPTVTASATAPDLAHHGWPTFHRVVADDDAEGAAAADYLVKSLGDKTVAVVDDGSPYGTGLASTVRSQLRADGAEDALDEHVSAGGADLSTAVARIVAAKVTGVFFGGDFSTAGALVAQLRAAGYVGAFMSGDGSDSPQLTTVAGSGAAEHAYVVCGCDDTSEVSAAGPFNAAYRGAYGSAPGPYAAESYDGANFVLAAIKAGATSPAAIEAYLGDHTYSGITQSLNFMPNGDLQNPKVHINQVRKGQLVQIDTVG